jgi:hypothetical protein
MDHEPEPGSESPSDPSEETPPFDPDLDLIGWLERGLKPDPQTRFRIPNERRGSESS